MERQTVISFPDTSRHSNLEVAAQSASLSLRQAEHDLHVGLLQEHLANLRADASRLIVFTYISSISFAASALFAFFAPDIITIGTRVPVIVCFCSWAIFCFNKLDKSNYLVHILETRIRALQIALSRESSSAQASEMIKQLFDECSYKAVLSKVDQRRNGFVSPMVELFTSIAQLRSKANKGR